MHISILMKALGILRVSSERIKPIELTICWIVVSSSKVLLLRSRIPEFTGVSKRGQLSEG